MNRYDHFSISFGSSRKIKPHAPTKFTHIHTRVLYRVIHDRYDGRKPQIAGVVGVIIAQGIGGPWGLVRELGLPKGGHVPKHGLVKIAIQFLFSNRF